MAKQVVKKLEDKYVGSLGLRFDRVFSTEVDAFALSKPQAEIVTQLRWWGESYGFFHRKSDAAVFASELTAILGRGIFAFGIEIQKHLINPEQTEKWFIDPETKAAKLEITNRRGLNLEPLSSFPVAAMQQGLELPLQVQAAIAQIDAQKTASLSNLQHIHLGRLITVALNIVILLSGFDSEEESLQTDQYKPLLVLRTSGDRDAMLELGCYIASSELAKTNGSSLSVGTNYLPAESRQLLTTQLDKVDAKLVDYSEYMYSTYGLFNSLIFGTDPEYPNAFAFNHVQEEIQVEQPKTERVKAEALPQPKAEKVTQPIVTKSDMDLNSFSYRFQIGKAECVAVVQYDGADPVGLDIFAHKVTPITVNYLATVSAFSTKLLKSGSSLEDISDLLVDIIFEPYTSESTSILDYVGKWIKESRLAA